MRIYLASSYDRYEEMQGVRDVLTALGHEITSHWIDRAAEVPAGTTENIGNDPQHFSQYARADLDDLDAAEVVISFTGGGRGGRHTEFGYALARGKYLILVGQREHVFHTVATEWYPDWSRLVMAVSRSNWPESWVAPRAAYTPDGTGTHDWLID